MEYSINKIANVKVHLNELLAPNGGEGRSSKHFMMISGTEVGTQLFNKYDGATSGKECMRMCRNIAGRVRNVSEGLGIGGTTSPYMEYHSISEGRS